MAAVRIVPRLQTSDQRQLQYQSARTRSKNPRPSDSKAQSGQVHIDWDEVFVFEIEPQVNVMLYPACSQINTL